MTADNNYRSLLGMKPKRLFLFVVTNSRMVFSCDYHEHHTVFMSTKREKFHIIKLFCIAVEYFLLERMLYWAQLVVGRRRKYSCYFMHNFLKSK